MRPSFRGFRTVLFFILFLLIFLPPASGQEKVKIGVITPLTGAIAHSGKDHLIGAEIAAERINAAGGVKSATRGICWKLWPSTTNTSRTSP